MSGCHTCPRVLPAGSGRNRRLYIPFALEDPDRPWERHQRHVGPAWHADLLGWSTAWRVAEMQPAVSKHAHAALSCHKRPTPHGAAGRDHDVQELGTMHLHKYSAIAQQHQSK